MYGNLPKLIPPDASQIGTARFKHYQAQSDEWNQRVTIAGKEGHAEDILTLAGDVPSPYYRRKLLRQCGEALLALGRFAQAEKIFQELCRDVDGDELGGRAARQDATRACWPIGLGGEAKRSKD